MMFKPRRLRRNLRNLKLVVALAMPLRLPFTALYWIGIGVARAAAWGQGRVDALALLCLRSQPDKPERFTPPSP